MTAPATRIYFSDFFDVHPAVLAAYGAFDVSLISDLPLFIDPFLLFNSDKAEYQSLHDEIIRYMVYLSGRATGRPVGPGVLEGLYTFREVKETWLGYSRDGNQGRGLGTQFGTALHGNLGRILAPLGSEGITRGMHLEKLCLIADGVGKDSISDFATNLIKPYLLRFTEHFALTHLQQFQRKRVAVSKGAFNYDTGTWSPGYRELPFVNGAHVILTPVDMLTKDDVWINKTDLIRDYDHIVASVTNTQLRGQLDEYFNRRIGEIVRRDDEKKRGNQTAARHADHKRRRSGRSEPSQRQTDETATDVIRHFPEVIDYYIRFKEDHGEEAEEQALERVRASERLFYAQVRALAQRLEEQTDFYSHRGDTVSGSVERLIALKGLLQDGDGRKLLYHDDAPVVREADLHIVLRNTWCNVPREGGGVPVPDGARTGCYSKSVVQIKAASNNNLGNFLKAASEEAPMTTARGIICYDATDAAKVRALFDALKLQGRSDIVVLMA